VTVNAYDRRLDTYFARKDQPSYGMNEEKEMRDHALEELDEKITREEYILH